MPDAVRYVVGEGMETWRLLVDGPLDAAANMACDEALLESMAAGVAPPTLRLYQWRPAALSLGRFQRSAAVDTAACARVGVSVVRRPSGGRALLHDSELTYALVAPAEHPRAGGATVLESYRRISLALAAGLRRLGAAVELAPALARRAENRGRQMGDEGRKTAVDVPLSGRSQVSHAQQAEPGPLNGSAACYDTAAGHELTVAGRKLVGSAQARRRGALLQHGAIPLTGHAARLGALLADPPARLEARMIALDEALGRSVAADEVAAALAAGIAGCWGVRLVPGELTGAERAAADRLRERYRDPTWTYGR